MKLKNIIMSVLVLFAVVPAALITFVYLSDFRDKSRDMIRENLTTVGDLQGTYVYEFFKQSTASLSTISNFDFVKEYVFLCDQDSTFWQRSTARKDMVTGVIYGTKYNSEFISILAIADKNAVIIASSDPSREGSVIARGRDMKYVKDGGVFISDVFYDYENGKRLPYIFIAIPIYIDGAYSGFIAQRLNASYLIGILGDVPSYESGLFTAPESLFRIVAASDRARWISQDISLINRVRLLEHDSGRVDLQNNPQGIFEHYANGERALAYYKHIKGTQYYVITSAKLSIIAAGTYNVIAITLVFLFLCMLAIVALSNLVSGLLSSPIKIFISRMQRAQGGDYSQRFEYDSDNELGEVVSAFNAFIDTIQKNTKELQDSQKRFLHVLETTSSVVFEGDITNDRVLSGFEQWKDVFGIEIPRNLGFENFIMNLAVNVVYIEDRESFKTAFLPENVKAQFEQGKKEISLEFESLDENGELRWYSLTMIPSFDEDSGSLKVVGYVKDINKLKVHEISILHQAQRDGLSGLYNKSTTNQMIEDVLSKSDPDRSLHGFFILDIDDFKNVNDTYGHLFGDTVISQAALALKKAFRHTDIIGRVGGDEFVVFVKNVDSRDALEETGERTMRMLNDNVLGEDSPCKFSMSMGLSSYPVNGKTLNELYQAADKALYDAKKAGKSRFMWAETGSGR